MFGSVINTSW